MIISNGVEACIPRIALPQPSQPYWQCITHWRAKPAVNSKNVLTCFSCNPKKLIRHIKTLLN
ncbi:hypothetical protein CR513_62254, partial [Mucuna pruriens]